MRDANVIVVLKKNLHIPEETIFRMRIITLISTLQVVRSQFFSDLFDFFEGNSKTEPEEPAPKSASQNLQNELNLGKVQHSHPNFEIFAKAFLQDLENELISTSQTEDQNLIVQNLNYMAQNFNSLLLQRVEKAIDEETFFDVENSKENVCNIFGGSFVNVAIRHNLLDADDCHNQKDASSSFDRNLGNGDVHINLKGVWDYGCYCNFGDKLTQGKGAPVSQEDALCRSMQLCLRCAELDAAERGEYCDTKTTNYTSTLGQGGSSRPAIKNNCESQNENLCQVHTCICEITLINDFLDLFWSGYTHDTAPRHPSNPYGVGCFYYPGIPQVDFWIVI